MRAKLSVVVAGIGLVIIVSIAAAFAADWVGESVLGFERSPVSAIMMAIIIGMVGVNTVSLPAAMVPGLRFCASTVLRVGIMLLGIRLSLLGAGRFTLVALPFVVFIAAGLFLRTFGLDAEEYARVRTQLDARRAES